MAASRQAITAPWRLVARGLDLRRGVVTVLRGVDVEIQSGECVSLIGPNGAGKTTLMLALLGLIEPSSGVVTIDDLPLRRLAPKTRGRFAAYVPQFVERVPAFSVYDVVASGRYPHTRPLQPLGEHDHKHVRRILEMCGLTSVARRPVNQLSGGERQKTLIAAAIAQDAQILFLDEPSTALDPAHQVDLVRLLRTWRTGGRALCIISHELALPGALGGRVVALGGGKIVADAPAETVLAPESLSNIFGARFHEARTAGGARVAVPEWD